MPGVSSVWWWRDHGVISPCTAHAAAAPLHAADEIAESYYRPRGKLSRHVEYSSDGSVMEPLYLLVVHRIYRYTEAQEGILTSSTFENTGCLFFQDRI